MKIYISGSITGDANYIKTFEEAEAVLKEGGYEVVNPVTVGRLLLLRYPELKNLSKKDLYKAYMREDIEALLECDAIYMIPGWQNSPGATFELTVSNMCGIRRFS